MLVESQGTNALIMTTLSALRFTAFALAVAASAAWGYRPPVDTADGLSLRIEGLEQIPAPPGSRNRRDVGCRELDATQPITFDFTLSNGTARAVSGTFTAWMNDDWRVEGAEQETIELPPGGVKRLQRTGVPGPRVLPALYPIHASFAPATGGTILHPVGIFRAKTPNRAFTRAPKFRNALTEGTWRLDCDFAYTVSVEVKDVVTELENPNRPEPLSHGSFARTPSYGAEAGGRRKRGFNAHPPYMKGPGAVRADFPLALPAVTPVKLKFDAMLSTCGRPRNPGDGVTMRVLAKEQGADDAIFRELYTSHVAESGAWYPGEADLSAFAGRKIVLRLAGDPGPEMNTSFDSHTWADPRLEIGAVPAATDEAAWRAREAAAVTKARAALAQGGDEASGRYLLEDCGERYGAAVEEGPAGFLDAVFAFTDGEKDLTIRGFSCEIDGEILANLTSRPYVRVRVSAEKGALRVAWDTREGPAKAVDGSPRFTRLAPGPASQRAWRVYAGFGSVWENLQFLDMQASGHSLSTRHVGFDYPNGLSLVQATDVPHDRLEVDASNRVARLVAHNDAVFTFVPSARGAFAAARRFAAVSGYRAAPGVEKMLGRMCIDDWSGNYKSAAATLRRFARYGLKDLLYLQHNWQRWGYDRRLPEVYPPRGNRAKFDDMVRAAKEAGYLFGIHDNYVDYYPDAPGFSYDLMCFNPDGTPLEAWYNPGPQSLSYRWLPHAIHPTLKRNMALQRDGFNPNALFIDVFTASMPKDVIDRQGVFYPAARNVKEWCDAWRECREVYGVPDAVMVSEAGNDTQIGFVDAAASDHYSPWKLTPQAVFDDGERVPWHDAVTHGKMLLLGGGLGARYSQPVGSDKPGDQDLHGYASDDYFCTTVIGGRVPMAALPDRKAVTTYWLLNNLCAALGRAEFETFAFDGDNLHRQHATFSGGGDVRINRDPKGPWKLADGTTLPTYGFLARAAGNHVAGVVEIDGQRVGFAESPGLFFVDARPPAGTGEETYVASRVLSAELRAPNRLHVKVEWTLDSPMPDNVKTFTHIVSPKTWQIAFHGQGARLTPEQRAKAGTYISEMIIDAPKSAEDGDYAIRYGLFDPQRLVIRGFCDDERRVRGGTLTVRRTTPDGTPALTWRAETTGTERDIELGLNIAGKMIDFGGIRTEGAFRLDYSNADSWTVLPLPGSCTFHAEIDLARFGAAGRHVATAEPFDPNAAAPVLTQQGDVVSFASEGNGFRLLFKK